MTGRLDGLPGHETIVLAEQALLGALLLQPRHLTTTLATLEARHFYLPHHEALFTAMRRLATAGHPALQDGVSSENGLDWVQQATALGAEQAPALTPAYAYALIAACPQPRHAAAYGRMVLAGHARRAIAEHATRLQQTAREAPRSTAGAELSCGRADELAGVLEQLARQWRPHPGSFPRAAPGGPSRQAGADERRVADEQVFLSAATARPSTLKEIRSFLAPEDFALPLHRQLYGVLAALDHRGEVIDPVTVMWEAQHRGVFQDGRSVLADVLAVCEPSGADPVYWADRVLEHALLATAAEAADRVVRLAADPTLTPHQLIAASRRALGELTATRARRHHARRSRPPPPMAGPPHRPLPTPTPLTHPPVPEGIACATTYPRPAPRSSSPRTQPTPPPSSPPSPATVPLSARSSPAIPSARSTSRR